METKPAIAVVEDDKSVREAIVGLLQLLGFTANGFSSADAFLKSDRIHLTNCLISDMQMPELTGLALYDHLVAVGTPIPTIFITAYPDETARARALNAGATGYLIKPFSEKDLLDCIDLALKHDPLLAPTRPTKK